MTTKTRLGAHVLSLAMILAALVLPAASAHASCAAAPVPSAYSFTGTVISVEHAGRTAQVRMDDGRDVIVRGGAAGDNTVTSVDRRYAVGGRYEFHPVNDASPFQDNACTATRQLSGPQPPPVAPAEDRLPGWLPIDEQAGPVGYLIFIGALVAMLGVVAAALVGGRGLARHWHPGPPTEQGA